MIVWALVAIALTLGSRSRRRDCL